MEIEKKRETTWNIQAKDEKSNIQITSVEIGGDVKIIKIGITKNKQNIEVKLNKEEFFNFLSIVSAFKDVVIGDNSDLFEEQYHIDISKDESDFDFMEPLSDIVEKEDEEKLDPKEWDPW